MKHPFPLPASDVSAVLTTLAVAVPALAREQYTLEQLISELIDPNPDLHAAAVHKRRRRYLVDECMVEFTDVTVDGVDRRTVAAESPRHRVGHGDRRQARAAGSPQRVRRARPEVHARVRRPGFRHDRRRNELGQVPPRRTAAPTGRHAPSSIAPRSPGSARDSSETGELSRCGAGAHGRRDRGNGRRGAVATTPRIVAVGTAGLRIATNRQAFLDAVKQRTGIDVEVISGEEEGRLAYVAATSALPIAAGRLVVFDSGGGSSQFTFGDGTRVDERFSVDVGAVRFTERFGFASAVDRDTVELALAAIAGDLTRLDGRPRPASVIGMGGTATNLAAVKHGLAEYDPDVVHGTVLTLDEIDREIELYRTRDAEQRRSIPGLQPARAEVILAGACIVRTILTKLGHDSLTVSDRGLRHGVFLERFGS